jgi:hypothetical protein
MIQKSLEYVKIYNFMSLIDYLTRYFTRDIGFVIDGIFIKSNILPERERELDVQYVIDQIDAMKVVRPPEKCI